MKKSTAIERTPARRMTTSSQSSSNNQYRHTMQKIETNSQIDDAYKLKRLRNNNAVRRTREKSKQTAMERKRNVENLRIKNKELEIEILAMKKNVEKLKEIILHTRKPKEYTTILGIITRDRLYH